MITVVTLNQKTEWKQVIRSTLNYDFYHTWDYHNLSKEGEPVLLKFNSGGDVIALPLIKRQIPCTDFFDMTCVYGYTGPVSNQPFDKMDYGLKEKFRSELLVFLKEHRFVSVFSRLHPYLNQLPLMSHFDGIHDNGEVVMIDLLNSLEEQRSRYLKGHLKKIAKLAHKGFYIKAAKSEKDISAFAAIYLENMRFIRACDKYLFREDYFRNLILSSEFDCRLIMVYHNDLPVCGAIIALTNKIIELHFLATLTSYRKFSPAKLIIDEIALLGRESAMHYLNLGGGYGFKPDSLFRFKTSFSDLLRDYKSWRYVVDQNIYNDLLASARINPDKKIDFFPLYRYSA